MVGSGHVSAEDPPVPLKPSIGYRDYCQGFSKSVPRACPPGHVPARLWRVLSFPQVAPDGECPVSVPHRISKRFAPVLGSAPVYVGTYAYGGDNAVVEMPWPAPSKSPAYGSGWTTAKIVLVMRKELRQPLLVRGQRLDEIGSLGFSGPAARSPFAAIQFPPRRRGIDEGRFKAFGLRIWATAPGCYGVQIDGKTFLRDVVFRVVLSP
jgi:hypothetical protein